MSGNRVDQYLSQLTQAPTETKIANTNTNLGFINANLDGSSAGQGTRSQDEYINSTASMKEMYKAGVSPTEINRIMSQRGRDVTQVNRMRELANNRSWGETTVDTGASVAQGLGSGLLGIAQLGANAVNAISDNGVNAQVAGLSEDFHNLTDSWKSNSFKAARDLNTQEKQLKYRDNEAIAQTPLGKIAMDFGSALTTDGTSPSQALDIGASAIGSLLSFGVAGKGINAALNATKHTSKIGMGYRAAMNIAATEGGSAYSQTYNKFNNLTHEELEQGSEEYRLAIAKGMSKDEAKKLVISRAATLASTSSAISGAILSPIAGRFESSLFTNAEQQMLSRVSADVRAQIASLKAVGKTGEADALLRNTVGSSGAKKLDSYFAKMHTPQALAREGFEETSQETANQLHQNRAEKLYINKNKDITEGVGEAGAQGFIGGIGAVVGTRAPSSALGGIVASAKVGSNIAGKVGDKLSKDKVDTTKAEPITEQDINEVNTELTSDIEQGNITPEQAEKVKWVLSEDFVKTELGDEKAFDISEYSNTASEIMGEMQNIEGFDPTNKGDVANVLLNIANNKDAPTKYRTSALAMLSELETNDNTSIGSILNATSDNFGPKTQKVIDKLIQGVQTIDPNLVKATKEEILESIQKDLDLLKDKKDINLDDVDLMFHSMMIGDLNIDQSVFDNLMYQVEQGTIELTAKQQELFEVLDKVFDGIRQAKFDPNKGVDLVTKSNLLDGSSETKPSILQHIKGIQKSVESGDLQKASDQLYDMGFYAAHMQNKVEALNESFENNNSEGVSYLALNSKTRDWYKSKNLLNVKRDSENSIALAQQIAAESNVLTTAFNELASRFPELGVEPIKANALRTELTEGTPSEIASKYGEPKIQPTNLPGRKNIVLPDGKGNNNNSNGSNVDNNTITESKTLPDMISKLDKTRTLNPIKSMLGNIAKTIEKPIKDFSVKELEALNSLVDKTITLGDDLLGKAEDKQAPNLSPELIQSLKEFELISTLKNQVKAELDKRSKADPQPENDTKLLDNVNKDLKVISNNTNNFDFNNRTKKELDSFNTELDKVLNKLQILEKAKPDNADIKSKINEVKQLKEKTRDAKPNNNKTVKEVKVESNNQPLDVLTKKEATTKQLKKVLGKLGLDTKDLIESFGSDTKGLESFLSKFNDNLKIDVDTGLGFKLPFTNRYQAFMDALPTRIKRNLMAKSEGKGAVGKLFPNLLSQSENRFIKAFLPKPKSGSRILGSDSPIQDLFDSIDSLADTKGIKKKDINQVKGMVVYAKLINDLVKTELEKEIKKTLDQPIAKGEKETIRDRLLNPAPNKVNPLNWESFGLLNLLEPSSDGKDLQLNQALLEGATLAASEWIIEKDIRTARSAEDAREYYDSIVKSLGGTNNAIDRSPIFNGIGLGKDLALKQLSDRILKNWGLETNTAEGIHNTQGIPLAVAGEILVALSNIKLQDSSPITIQSEIFKVNGKSITGTKITRSGFDSESLVNKNRGVLDNLINEHHDYKLYRGDEDIPVNESQDRDKSIKLTKIQKESLDTLQKVDFKVNEPNLALFTAIPESDLVKLVADGFDINNENNADLYTEKDLEIRESQAMVVRGALDAIDRMVRFADSNTKEGQLRKDTPIRFKFGVASEGRLHMKMAFGPQDNKLTREVITPTRGIVDLSDMNSKAAEGYNRALAQALGIKVNNMSYNSIKNKLDTIIKGMPETIKNLENFYNNGYTNLNSKFLETAISEGNKVGADVNYVALSALNDYARFLNTKDKSSYESNLYLEADGISSGSVQAMMMWASSWKGIEKLLAKGGIYLNKDMDHGSYYETDPLDIYGVTGEALSEMNNIQVRELDPNNPNPTHNLENAFAYATTKLLPGFSLVGGKLVLNRNPIKGMQTPGLYGSGESSIAKNIYDDLVGEMHKGYSRVLQNRANKSPITDYQAFLNDPVVDPVVAQDIVNKLIESMNIISSAEKQYSPTGNYILNNQIANKKFLGLDSKNEDIRKIDLNNRRQLTAEALAMTFTDNFKNAMANSVGGNVFSVSQALIFGTSAISKAAKQMFEKAVKESYETGEGIVDGYITENRLNELKEQVKSLFPNIKSLDSELSITTEQSAPIGKGGKDTYVGKTLSNGLGSNASFNTFGDVGVRVAPLATIMFGDATTTYHDITTDPNIGTVNWIFDGKNQFFGNFEQSGLNVNKAFLDSQSNSPLFDAYLAMSTGMDNLLKFGGNDENFYKELLTPFQQKDAKRNEQSYKGYFINEMNPNIAILQTIGLASYGLSRNIPNASLGIDTYASAGKAYFQEGLDPNSKEFMDKVKETIDVKAKAHNIDPTVAKFFVENSEYNPTDNTVSVKKDISDSLVHTNDSDHIPLPNTFSVKPTPNNPNPVEVSEVKYIVYDSKNKQKFIDEIFNLFPIKDNKDHYYKALLPRLMSSPNLKINRIAIGTFKAMLAKGNITKQHAEMNFRGFYSFKTNNIIVNSNGGKLDTIVHEIVHAATSQVLSDYYKGNFNQKDNRDIYYAVDMLEQIGNHIADLRNSPEFDQYPIGYKTTIDVLSKFKQKGDMFNVVSELLAYGETDPDTAKELIKITNPLKPQNKYFSNNFVKKAIDKMITSVMNYLGIKNVPQNFLDHLRMNSAIIYTSNTSNNDSNSKPNSKSKKKDSEVMKQEDFTREDLFQNNLYGNDENLNKIMTNMTNALQGGALASSYSRANNHIMNIKASQTSIDSLINAQRYGFSFTPQQANAYEMIVATLATQSGINPSSLLRAQELHKEAMNQLSEDNFRSNNNPNDMNDIYKARQQYNFFIGKVGFSRDQNNISTVIPNFIALATVNPQVREILSNLKHTKDNSDKNTFNDYVDSYAKYSMDSLSLFLSGDKRKNTNVMKSIDSLMDNIVDINYRKENMIENLLGTVGKGIALANTAVVKGKDYISDKLWDYGSKNKGKFIGSLSTLVSSTMTDERASYLSRLGIRAANTGSNFKPIRELMIDIIGRTDQNKSITDLTKLVKAKVQGQRQEFRVEVPKVIASQFSRELTTNEWNNLTKGLLKYDLTSLIRGSSISTLVSVIQNDINTNNEISRLESEIRSYAPNEANYIIAKSKQLANYLLTGVAGNNLLRNVRQITGMSGTTGKGLTLDAKQLQSLDSLISLYAFQNSDPVFKKEFLGLIADQTEGFTFISSYIKEQLKTERTKNAYNSVGKVNMPKGYVPYISKENSTLIVADNSKHNELIQLGYTKLADYYGSRFEKGTPKSYYFMGIGSKPMFNQGIMLNVRESVNGIDSISGKSNNPNAGLITNPVDVKRIHEAMLNNTFEQSKEGLIPLYKNVNDLVPYAFERIIDSKYISLLDPTTQTNDLLGAWRGRQVEEFESGDYNRMLIDNAHKMYIDEVRKEPTAIKQYVDIFSDQFRKVYPVQADALSLIPPREQAYMKALNHGKFMVRKDMFNDMFGYRTPSIGDMWTGISNWDPKTQAYIRNILESIFGKGTFRKLVRSQNVIESVVNEMKTNIIVRSIIVPVINALSNVIQAVARGTPIKMIARGYLKYTREIHGYTKYRERLISIEAELRAVGNNTKLKSQLELEKQTINDSIKRMFIYPLIEAGEFTSVAEGMIDANAIELTNGNLMGYIEKVVDKLPLQVKTPMKNLMLTKDTSLYKALQTSVDYSDFIAKAVYYEDLISQGKTKEEALGKISEEYINYDRLGGRFRTGIERVGMAWFLNWKIRSIKIALSLLRNNPLTVLMANMIPLPDSVSNVGTPVEDSGLTKLLEGKLGYSFGPGMGLRSFSLTPLGRLVL